ncbi:hypothetical protein ASPSYDRAFT_41369 [Aspergillus sydowii CBS 593.65]|uniref:Uncharacterized protein n=1 Tax=Aspergillus sydowii CBS 593.65 TaxID=1036612 RepID=A0A1L9TTJ6_9EURO|nr:uncharacterized protein ASPSYDRAFT_41369 [Aspergillus sydowii CBS 593.65]OJJ62705.1 hypothetical protein ASPSYDRAFT_41369 [Aspergillus sydowii CBS 593.65]
MIQSRWLPKKNLLLANRSGSIMKVVFLGYHSITLNLVSHLNGISCPKYDSPLTRLSSGDVFPGTSLKRPREDSDNPPSKRQHLSEEENPLLKLSSGNLFSGASLKRPREDSDNPPSKRQHLS